MYDKEIEEIKTKSGINLLFKLNWNVTKSQLENICQIDLNTNQNIPTDSSVKTPVSQAAQLMQDELQRQLQNIAFTEDIGMSPPRDEQLIEELGFVNSRPLIDEPWDCTYCTFRNEYNSINCDACDLFRFVIEM